MATTTDFENKVLFVINALPRLIGNEAIKFFQSQMMKEQDVKGRDYQKRGYERRLQRGKRILSDRGNLFNSIEILNISSDSVEIGVDDTVLGYAQIHNEGGQIQVTANMKGFFWAKHYEANKRDDEDDASFYKAMALKRKGDTLDIPKREFIGESELLTKHIEQAVQDFIDSQLNSL